MLPTYLVGNVLDLDLILVIPDPTWFMTIVIILRNDYYYNWFED